MKEFFFKTSVNCEGCLKRLKPMMDGHHEIKKWSVDLNHPDKILADECEGLNASDIICIVDDAGFEIELIK